MGLVPAGLERLWPLLVRRVALGAEGRTAALRLELASGPLAGATLLLRSDPGDARRIHVTLSGARDADLDRWRARIGARLLGAGLQAEVD